MTESGRRRNPLRPRTVSGPPPGPAAGPPPGPVEADAPSSAAGELSPEPAAVDAALSGEAGEQGTDGWFREEPADTVMPVAAASGVGIAAATADEGLAATTPAPPLDEATPSAAGMPVADAGEEQPATVEPAGFTEGAEVAELVPGTEPTAPETVPVRPASAAAAPSPAPRRGSATARLRTLVISLVVVALTAMLGFAAGMLLPALVPGPGIAGAPTAEPTVAPTVEPTIAPTDEPTIAPTVEPTEAPAATPEPTAGASPKVTIHVVKAGENLSTIAAKYGVTVKAIQELNGITNPNKIYPGQKLKIPPKS